MSRKLSLYVLAGTAVLIGILFYRVIQPFIFSLLFAAVLAVMFGPLHRWLADRMGQRRRVAAGIMTLGILALIILPLGTALTMAGLQLFDISKEAVEWLQSPEDSKLSDDIKGLQQSRLASAARVAYRRLSSESQSRLENVVQQAADGFAKTVYEQTMGFVGDVLQFLIGLVVTGLAVYYFLADGDTLLREAKELTPMEDKELDELIKQFGQVCRGVVAGTVVAALAQAMMAGIGYVIAGLPNVLLLVTVTMFCAFIPFVGAGSVVTLASLWLALEQRYLAAILLFAYSLTIVSTSDNLIRAYVIGSEAKMNPLVAFITVVGAMQFVGLWGIFVGPMVAAFFYTLLKLLRQRIAREKQEEEVRRQLATA